MVVLCGPGALASSGLAGEQAQASAASATTAKERKAFMRPPATEAERVGCSARGWKPPFVYDAHSKRAALRSPGASPSHPDPLGDLCLPGRRAFGLRVAPLVFRRFGVA